MSPRLHDFASNKEFGKSWELDAIFYFAKEMNLSPENIMVSSEGIDKKECGDWIIPGGKHVAYRIRRHEYYYRPYGEQFTIRAFAKHGTPEIEKILLGFGAFLFYCFATEKRGSHGTMTAYRIVDLDRLRKINPPCSIEDNGDGSGLAAIRISDCLDAIIARVDFDGIAKARNKSRWYKGGTYCPDLQTWT